MLITGLSLLVSEEASKSSPGTLASSLLGAGCPKAALGGPHQHYSHSTEEETEALTGRTLPRPPGPTAWGPVTPPGAVCGENQAPFSGFAKFHPVWLTRMGQTDLLLCKLRSQAVSRQGRLDQKGRVSKGVERCVQGHTAGAPLGATDHSGAGDPWASGAWPCPS